MGTRKRKRGRSAQLVWAWVSAGGVAYLVGAGLKPLNLVEDLFGPRLCVVPDTRSQRASEKAEATGWW